MRAEQYRQLSGATVVGTDGPIGTVERTEYGPENGAKGSDVASRDREPQSLVVRALDGGALYRIPLLFVRAVTPASADQPQVTLNLPTDQLAYYRIDEAATAAAPTGEDLTATTDDSDTVRIPTAEEHLVAHKAPVVQGVVHIHKEVGTRHEDFTIPVYHEQAIVERIPADKYDGQPPADDELLIPVTEERLVVRKETVVREYLRVRKQLVSQEHQVRGDVRRETLDVTTESPPGSEPQHLLHLPDDAGTANPSATR